MATKKTQEGQEVHLDKEAGKIRFRRRRYKHEVYAGVKGRTPAARKKVLEVALTEEHAVVLEGIAPG